ncbi:MAG: PilZ domain-containing protein [Bdellovibrionota bacterium]
MVYQTAVALVYYSDQEFRLPVFLATGAGQLFFIYIVGREIRVPYFFPRIRWWESDPRYKLSVQTRLNREEKKDELEGEIMDLSVGGCFIKTHGFFMLDEPITLHFTLFEKNIECRGRVVWRTESMVTHPKGIGVKFDTLSKENVFCLKQATKKMKELAKAYSQMTRERNWQEYLQREQRYQGRRAPIISIESAKNNKEKNK